MMLFSLGMAAHVFQKETLLHADTACLDGSDPVFYFSQTSSLQGTLILFEDGETCIRQNYRETIRACSQAAKTRYGSTRFEKTEWLEQLPPIMSDRQDQNIAFHKFRKIFVRYCDATFHQGYRLEPQWLGGQQNLYFKGSKNTQNLFTHLYMLGLLKSPVVLAGRGLAGLAAAMWADSLASSYSVQVKVLADSPLYFPMIGQSGAAIHNLFSYANKFLNSNRTFFPQHCAGEDCYFPSQVFAKLAAPTLILQPNYPKESLVKFLGLSCVQSGSMQNCSGRAYDITNKYFQMLQVMVQQLRHSVWSVSCIVSSLFQAPVYRSLNYRHSQFRGLTAEQAVAEWLQLQNQSFRWLDSRQWPKNLACSNYVKQL